MPRIPDRHLDVVIYLFPTEKAAEKGSEEGGSGFLVTVPSAIQSVEHVYAVTNKHVKEVASTIRFRTADGKSVVRQSHRKEWMDHPDGTDVSAFYLGFSTQLPNARAFSREIFLTEANCKKFNVGIGDEVYMIGRFLKYERKRINEPTLRFGNIVMNATSIPDAGLGPQLSFLVEMRSLSGYSGSPVFLYMSPIHGRDGGEFPAPEESGWLLGINRGHIPYDEVVIDGKGKKVSDYHVETNVGIAAVVPAWKILELLEGDVPTKQRKQKDTALAKEVAKNPIKPDAAIVPGVTREQFMKDLETVVRRGRRPRGAKSK